MRDSFHLTYSYPKKRQNKRLHTLRDRTSYYPGVIYKQLTDRNQLSYPNVQIYEILRKKNVINFTLKRILREIVIFG